MTQYPRLPEWRPRQASETAEAYGLRALAFVVRESVTATVPTDALELADHVFPLAVSHPELSPVAAAGLADVQRIIRAVLRSRLAPVGPTAAVQATAGQGKPMIGPGAPLQPTPVVQPP